MSILPGPSPCLQAGTLDTLIDRLPGWPDNINRSSDGNFWLALVVPDVPLVMPAPLCMLGNAQWNTCNLPFCRAPLRLPGLLPPGACSDFSPQISCACPACALCAHGGLWGGQCLL